MPAYMIALNRRVHDRQKLEAYWRAAGATFEGRGAKPLSVYTPLTPLELMGSLEGVVLIEFPCGGSKGLVRKSGISKGKAAPGRRSGCRVFHC